MRLFIQRVLQAEVTVEGNTVGKIGKGLLVFVGAGKEDNREIADKYLKKLLGLRIFEDEAGKTNLSLKDVEESFCWFPSLLCMQTAKREIVPALLKPELRIWQKNFMSI